MQDLFDLDDECWEPYFVEDTTGNGKTQVIQVKPFTIIPDVHTRALNDWIHFATRLRDARYNIK